VDSSYTCGEEIIFDLLDVTTTNEPITHADRRSIFSLMVLDDYGPPVTSVQLDEDFDPTPPSGWSHEAGIQGVPPCLELPHNDEWQILSKDAEHGDSYHCGKGPGDSYGRLDYSWLYYGGTDSQAGAGIDVPASGIGATLTIVHWYDTAAGYDGGQVLIDPEGDGQDVYIRLEPEGGYPAGTLATGYCNVLEGSEAFHGSSGGWITSTFDLTHYMGRRIWLAFLFASDRLSASGEGWYIDQVKVESLVLGDPICQVTQWPGSVPSTVTYNFLAPDSIEAVWDPSCNLGELPGQSYSIQAGDIHQLQATGVYSHAPIGGVCELSSPATFTPGTGSEYYLLVPTEGNHEGGAGVDSDGWPRPSSEVCGLQRVAECP
jgi:hypothetical protein